MRNRRQRSPPPLSTKFLSSVLRPADRPRPASVHRGSPGPPSRHPASPPPRPAAHLALHLHGAQAAAAQPVPVAAVHAEHPAGGRLVGGRPSGARAAGPRTRGLGTRSAARRLVTAPAEVRAALGPVLRGGPRVGLAVRQAGTRVPPREARGRRRPRRGEGGALSPHSRRSPASRLPPPRARARPGARARRHGCSRGTCARSPAASEQPRPLALRPHPIGSAHLRPRRQPIGARPARLARRVGGPRAPRAPPTLSRLALRCEGGAGSPETGGGPLWMEQGSTRTHAPAVEFPPREGDRGRQAGSAPGQRLRRGCFFFSLAHARERSCLLFGVGVSRAP